MTPQEKFNSLYISSAEICQMLGITRGGLVLAKKKGILPDPIMIPGGQIHIWDREEVMPALTQWHQKRNKDSSSEGAVLG